jgi:hypothetical protein
MLAAAVGCAAAQRRGSDPGLRHRRTQEILYDLRGLGTSRPHPLLPVYRRSVGDEATAIYARHRRHDPDAGIGRRAGALRAEEPAHLQGVEDSAAQHTDGPGILVAGSGWRRAAASSITTSAGSRRAHHRAVRRLPDRRHARPAEEGAQRMKMLGQSVPVRAKPSWPAMLPAHADRGPLLAGGSPRPGDLHRPRRAGRSPALKCVSPRS